MYFFLIVDVLVKISFFKVSVIFIIFRIIERLYEIVIMRGILYDFIFKII